MTVIDALPEEMQNYPWRRIEAIETDDAILHALYIPDDAVRFALVVCRKNGEVAFSASRGYAGTWYFRRNDDDFTLHTLAPFRNTSVKSCAAVILAVLAFSFVIGFCSPSFGAFLPYNVWAMTFSAMFLLGPCFYAYSRLGIFGKFRVKDDFGSTLKALERYISQEQKNCSFTLSVKQAKANAPVLPSPPVQLPASNSVPLAMPGAENAVQKTTVSV